MGDGEDNREKIGQSAKRGAHSGEGGANSGEGGAQSGEGGAQSVVCHFTRKGEAQNSG